jgi:signal transduction histidine kinase
MPVLFIQTASTTAERDKGLAKIQAEIDEEIADLEAKAQDTLTSLRNHLLMISGVTFAATVLGGFALVWLGLRPLRRLSDAVSRVSTKDFRLPLDDRRRLPNELRPIAERLTQTLDMLKRAFAREKQAAADISHELRTPLAALMTTLDVALKKPRSPEEYRELLEDCRLSGQRHAADAANRRRRPRGTVRGRRPASGRCARPDVARPPRRADADASRSEQIVRGRHQPAAQRHSV